LKTQEDVDVRTPVEIIE